MIEEALAYASQGFHVFPILPGQKRPLTQHGFKEATTDPEQIRGWWTETPDANIGWYPHPSGHCVVDLDLDHADLDLPPTRVNETPSGGEHHIFLGELPPTQSKLGTHIDTRGLDSYVLLPPSVVGGNAYKVKHDRPLAYVPWEFGERLTKVKPEPRHTEKRIDEIDTPERILWMRDLARAADPATEFEGSNDATVELANRLLDWCSHDEVYDAMWGLWAPRCQGEWTGDWLSDKVYSIKQGCGRDSAIGCAEFEQPAYTPDATSKPNRRSRFTPVTAAEMVDLPEPTFWDPGTNVIPKDGIVLIYGQPGSHKTNLTLTLLFDMMANGARVIYAAGEGSLGVGKARIPAHARARGIELPDNLAVVRAVPMLQMGEDVSEFIGAIADFKPDIVVIDTLATATSGLDENSSMFSSLLTDNGAVGVIRRALSCTIIIVAHEGKSAGKGIRGHSGLLGNVDAAIQVTAEGPSVQAHVTKMRDGKDNFSLFAKVIPGEVPVPAWITRAEFEASKPRATKESDTLAEIHQALKILGAHKGGTKDMGVTVGELSRTMILARGDEPTAHSIDAQKTKLKGLGANVYRMREEGKSGTSPWVWVIPEENSN